ncbi:unnamed protein product [Linum trigynum]|uniref:Uncharacterized protein n=1 Tax=Linum trigynum TaxID=586398 RepID=A0AAV2GQ89_9ROSI
MYPTSGGDSQPFLPPFPFALPNADCLFSCCAFINTDFSLSRLHSLFSIPLRRRRFQLLHIRCEFWLLVVSCYPKCQLGLVVKQKITSGYWCMAP